MKLPLAKLTLHLINKGCSGDQTDVESDYENQSMIDLLLMQWPHWLHVGFGSRLHAHTLHFPELQNMSILGLRNDKNDSNYIFQTQLHKSAFSQKLGCHRDHIANVYLGWSTGQRHVKLNTAEYRGYI